MVNLLVRILNENLLKAELGLFEAIMACFETNGVFLNDKERYILNSLPNVVLATNALQTYKYREATGYLTAILAL